MTHAIPPAALDDRLGFTGTAGSGKTYTASASVERLLDKRARVIVIDPLDVWWGLRLFPSGKEESGYDVVIFGGQKQDIPINEHAGALVGEAVASTSESCIISLEEISTGAGKRRFMLAFLTTLYRHHKGDPVHLIFDEADMFAPQRLLDKEGEAAKLLGMMETIIRRGRVKGFIPWLITQRPAVISKDVLSQMDGLITFKLTSSQDRKAIGAWVEGQADEGQWKEVYGELPTYQKGEGLVWIPGRRIFGRHQFPEKTTYDSSRTPKRGERHKTIDLPPLDIDELRGKLAAVAEEAKANDPKALKTEIAKLKAERARAPTHVVPDQNTLDKEFERGRDAGWKEAATIWHERLQPVLDDMLKTKGKRIAPRPVQPTSIQTQYRKASRPPPAPVHRRSSAEPGDDTLGKAHRKILAALAQYPDGRSKVQVAVLAGYAHKGGGFNNALSTLRRLSYIEGQDHLRITEEGVAALGPYDPLPVGHELFEYWQGQLPGAARKILEVLVGQYPETLTKEDVAFAAGYEAGGGGFNNALSRLRTLELVEGRGELKASDNLFG